MITHSGVECFLAICRFQTMTLAAERLYISQPSLSARLKTLEKEIGGQLFSRGKGNREMRLTAAGKAFFPLAIQYETITRQMLHVCENSADTIRVSAINSVATYFLPKVYNIFLHAYPHYHLEVQDMELEAATECLLEGTTDLSFTSGRTLDERLLQTPIYVEKMVLLGSRALANQGLISAYQLKDYKEIYVEWSRAYVAWHRQTFTGDHPQITVSIMTQLKQFLEQEDCWAIVPTSMATDLRVDCGLVECSTAFGIPNREISVVTAAGTSSKIVDEFFDCIAQAVSETPQLQSLL